MSDFEIYVQSLNDETAGFSQHWMTCALSIQPTANLMARPATK